MTTPAALAAGLRSLADRMDPIAGAVVLEAALELGRLVELDAAIAAPTVDVFDRGVVLEAVHQVDRWGAAHDAAKTPSDWVWLLASLATKAGEAMRAGDLERARHHAISTAAVCRNWHRRLSAIAGDVAGAAPIAVDDAGSGP